MHNDMEFTAGELVKQITLQVKITRMKRFNARLWMGLRLISLGAWIAGLGGVETEEEN